MAGFLYYIPGATNQYMTAGTGPQKLRELGLERPLRDLLDNWQPTEAIMVVGVACGPDGDQGVVLYPKPPTGEMPRTMGYSGETQEWRQVGGYWLGYDTEKPPTPEDLERPELAQLCIPTVLGDGNEWSCPVIRGPRDAPSLPSSWDIDESGEFVQQTVQTWRWAWDLAGEIWDHEFGEKPIEGDESQQRRVMFDWCASCLSLNYRVGLAELGMLGVVRSDNFRTILQAAILQDFLEMVNDEKKRQDGNGQQSSSFTHGDEAQPLGTDQAAQPSH